MLAIELEFPAGRYHATPWGQNVNEGIVEWPPSPYRLARSLVDVCRRRRPNWDDQRLGNVLRCLVSPLGFFLPPATSSHTRSFLSSNTRNPTDKAKVFDAFVVIDRGQKLLAAFDVEPENSVRHDLEELLAEMNYLGRSESWVRGRVSEGGQMPFNCLPAAYADEVNGKEAVTLACLRPEAEYHSLRVKPVAFGSKQGKPDRELTWLEAISMSTADLLREGWSEPPSQKSVVCLRDTNALTPRPKKHRRLFASRFTAAKYALHGAVRPRLTDTVPFAERIRRILMGIHKKVLGGDPAAVSPLFSGKDKQGRPATRHEHVFILPLDDDGDGRIDHLLIKAARPFEASELDALDRLRRVWQPGGRPELMLVLSSLMTEPANISSRTWASATPFVTRRHHRRGRGDYMDWMAQEVRRECGFHGIPEPETIEWTDRTGTEGRALRWMEFVRSRKGKRPLRGHGAVLTFREPVAGPFALGALCHFGLGLFNPRG
jgi:CRISPR-associated protein Csb2